MKKIKSILGISLILVFSLTTTTAQSQNVDIPNEIINAIGTGNVEVLSDYLNDNVELVVENKNNVYSKRQAIGILTDFFKKNTPSHFNVLHKGNKTSTSFLIGTLETSSGNYRVYLLTRKSDNKSVIQQIRIEKE